jgi:thiamine-phosphate pyrophosphorylase
VDNALLKSRNLDLASYISYLEAKNIEILQYRDKLKEPDILDKIRIIRENYSCQIIINDYIELIDFVDGLHLGQEDILRFDKDKKDAINRVRDTIGSKIFGISTHNRDEVIEANSFNIDYIGLGAYRATNTKSDIREIQGDALLEVAKHSDKKVALIGGVKIEDDFNPYPQIYYKVIGSDLIRDFLTK